ncbi:MAG: prenyltransferase/squalene oxidase repeat-containing protein [Anaerolineae bacterium]
MKLAVFLAVTALLLAVLLASRAAPLAAGENRDKDGAVETRHGASLRGSTGQGAPQRISSVTPATQTSEEQSAGRALDWLASAQAADGGYGDVATTLAVLRAVGDGGRAAADWRRVGGPSILTYLAPRLAAYADRDTISVSQAITALVAAGEDPRTFGGINLIHHLQTHFDPTSGLYEGRSGTTLDQVSALLALAAAHEPLPPTVVGSVVDAQADDGGWPPSAGAPSDVETTSLAAAALVAAGQDPSGLNLRLAASFLSRAQDSDGGFRRSSTCGCAPDAISTARAVPAVLLLGFDPLGDGWYRPNGAPTQWLARAQRPDGAVALAPNQPLNVRATAYAVTAWLGRPLVPLGCGAAVSAGLSWLRQRQRADGGFGVAGDVSDVDLTLDTLYALAAVGEDAHTWHARSGATPLDFLAARPTPGNAAGTARLILAVQAHGADPRDFGGTDLTQRLASFLDASQGVYGQTTLDQAWSLLALAALRTTPPAGAVEHLIGWQGDNGGWAPRPGVAADTTTTALALQALAAFDAADTVRSRARAYLMAQQLASGGFVGMDGDTDTSARATAAALQALAALGEDPREAPWIQHASPADGSPLPSHNPLQALLEMQDASGGFHPQDGFPELDASATAQALVALTGRAQPVRGQTLRVFLPLVLYRH